MEKFSKIDPHTCTIQELKYEVERLKELTDFYESKQLALKLFINAAYGSIANRFFCGYNVAVAESITLQGQNLNHYTENCINKYFSGVFQNDAELHKKLGIKTEDAKKVRLSGGKLTQTEKCNGPEFSYLIGDDSIIIQGDTDSVKFNTNIIINNEVHTFESWWNKLKSIGKRFNEREQEFINLEGLDLKSKGFNIKTNQIENNKVNYLMRHKVFNKQHYKITTASSNFVEVTGDHSCIVMRDGEVIEVKAKDIKKRDKLIVKRLVEKYQIEDIVSVEQLEDFNEEYVYDIEIDRCHNFFANGILVHNSVYAEFGRITNQLGITDEQATDFIMTLWNEGLGKFLNQCYEAYAKKWNCDKNLEVLELEDIGRTDIILAKKHYAMEMCWKEPDIKLEPLEEINYKGLELIQGSTPKYAKECQDDFYKWLFTWYANNNVQPKYEDLVMKVKSYKDKFCLQDPEDISKAMSVGDYNKFILEDKKKLTVALHCPIHVKAAGIANYLLYNHPKYKMKYNFIKKGEKVKFYYTTDSNMEVFAFLPNNYPLEYGLKIDYEKQFDTVVLAPINRVIEAIGYRPIALNMCWSPTLW